MGAQCWCSTRVRWWLRQAPRFRFLAAWSQWTPSTALQGTRICKPCHRKPSADRALLQKLQWRRAAARPATCHVGGAKARRRFVACIVRLVICLPSHSYKTRRGKTATPIIGYCGTRQAPHTVACGAGGAEGEGGVHSMAHGVLDAAAHTYGAPGNLPKSYSLSLSQSSSLSLFLSLAHTHTHPPRACTCGPHGTFVTWVAVR